jgi:hypothetical protein
MLADLTCPGQRFSDAHHPGPYMFVHPDFLHTLDVSEFPMLCYDASLIPNFATPEPKVFVFVLLKSQFKRIRSTVPFHFSYVCNCQQHPAFPDQYDPDDFCLLNHSSKGMTHFPFPDMREFDPEIAEGIRKWAEYSPCSHCRAYCFKKCQTAFVAIPLVIELEATCPSNGRRLAQSHY